MISYSYPNVPNPHLQTPWGVADNVASLNDSIITVTTSGHGGMGVDISFAENNLSKPAIRKGRRFKGFVWFEQDIDWCILTWELPAYWDRLVEAPDDLDCGSKVEYQRNKLLEVLSEWRPDYLRNIGIDPIPEKEQIYKDRRKAERMRKDNHPDLIVCTTDSDDHSVTVKTADGNVYRVTKRSYLAERFKELFLLSSCEVIVGNVVLLGRNSNGH